MGGVDMTNVTLPASPTRARTSRRVELMRVLLVVLAAVPYAAGRSAGAMAVAASWVWTAVLVGWRDATGGPAR